MIHIPPNIIKAFYLDNRTKLITESVLVADDKENGVEIYLTFNLGLPYFTIDVDGCTEFDELSTVPELEKDYERILNLYIKEQPVQTPPAEYTDDDLDDLTPRSAADNDMDFDDDTSDDDAYQATTDLIEILLGCTLAEAGIVGDDVHTVLDIVIETLNTLI